MNGSATTVTLSVAIVAVAFVLAGVVLIVTGHTESGAPLLTFATGLLAGGIGGHAVAKATNGNGNGGH